MFGDIDDSTPDILDLLKEKNTKATFFIHTDKITDENRPTLQRGL